MKIASVARCHLLSKWTWKVVSCVTGLLQSQACALAEPCLAKAMGKCFQWVSGTDFLKNSQCAKSKRDGRPWIPPLPGQGVLPAEDLPGEGLVKGSGPRVPFLSHCHQVLEQPCSGAYIRLRGLHPGRERKWPRRDIQTSGFNSVTELNVQITDSKNSFQPSPSNIILFFSHITLTIKI